MNGALNVVMPIWLPMAAPAGRWLVLFATFLLVGSAVSGWIARERKVASALRWSALLIVCGVAAQMHAQLHALEWIGSQVNPESAVSIPDAVVALAGTTWGMVRAAWVVLAVAVFVGSFAGANRAGRWAVTWLAVLAVASVPLLGHTLSVFSSVGADRSMSSALFTYLLALAHTAAGAVWLGTLLMLAPAWWRGVDALLPAIARYGGVALIAVPMALMSGGLTALLRTGGPSALIASSYGALVLLKVLLVLSTVALGGRHHLALVRAPQRAMEAQRTVRGDGRTMQDVDGVTPFDTHRVRMSLLLESALVLLVLAATAVLAETEPPLL